ncbi:MAG: hypothetical protein EXX96DRAFT_486814 [Benjaminiella poitrasii]|nr:MAG: hypothetical protein EXX96DRAFT_486814 [Benjaminiella poitrasii]
MAKSKRRQTTKSQQSQRRQQQQQQQQQQSNPTSSFQPLNMFFGGPRSANYQSIPSNDGDVTIDMTPNAQQQQQQQQLNCYHSDIETSSNSRLSSVEVDVCFPTTPNKKTEEEEGGIDYESLEEFIREERKQQTEQRTDGRNRRRRLSTLDDATTRRYSLYGDRIMNVDKSDTGECDRITYYSTAEPNTIHARSVSEIPGQNNSLSEMLKKGCFWIDVLNPTDVEMKALCKAFRIHPLTAEDISMEEQREKCEVFLNYYFVCFRSFDQDEFSTTYLQPSAIYIIILKEGVLTFHFKPMSHPHNVRKRMKQLKDYINVTPDDITDSFAPLIRAIEFEVDSIDELVLILKESEQSDMLRRIGYCRKRMMGLLRLLSPKTDVVKTLVKRGEITQEDTNTSRPPLTKEVALYLGDVQGMYIQLKGTHYLPITLFESKKKSDDESSLINLLLL